jgi:lysophospholipase L1-like esterase
MAPQANPTRPLIAAAALLAWAFLPAAGGLARLKATLRDDAPNARDYDRIERGYYERLIDHERRPEGPSRESHAPFDAGVLAESVGDVREYVLRPNLATTHKAASWTTNALGMRDRPYDLDKPEGTFRVALVGDSIAAGWGVDDGLGFESRLEGTWDERARAGQIFAAGHAPPCPSPQSPEGAIWFPPPLRGRVRVGGGQGTRLRDAGKETLPAGPQGRAPLTPHPALPLKGGGCVCPSFSGAESTAGSGQGATDAGTSPHDPRLEVLNFAVPGHAPGQRWEHFARVGWATDPDLILFEGTLADLGWDERRLRALIPRGLGLDASVYRDVLANLDITSNLPPDALKSRLRPHREAILLGVYRRVVADCRSRNIPAVWVLLPRVGKPVDPMDRATIIHLARIAGFDRLIDLSDAFDGRPASSLAIAPDDFHPNAEGHAILARRLDEALTEFLSRSARSDRSLR